MKEVKYMLGSYRFWAGVLLLTVIFLSLGGCATKQFVGVETGGIDAPADLMVPPEELVKREPAHTDITDVAPAWAADRRVGGKCIATLKDLQSFNRSLSDGRQKNKTTK